MKREIEMDLQTFEEVQILAHFWDW